MISLLKVAKSLLLKTTKEELHRGGPLYGFPIGTISKVKKIECLLTLQRYTRNDIVSNIFICYKAYFFSTFSFSPDIIPHIIL